MTKVEKTKSLERYLNDLKSRLASPVPSKHVGHPESFLRFLKNDIQTVMAQLESFKLDGGIAQTKAAPPAASGKKA